MHRADSGMKIAIDLYDVKTNHTIVYVTSLYKRMKLRNMIVEAGNGIAPNDATTLKYLEANRGFGLTAQIIDHCKLVLKFSEGTNSTWKYAKHMQNMLV